MFSTIRRLLIGRKGTETQENQDGTLPYEQFREWEWNRADEYPYDHYTDPLEEIKQLKRDRDHSEVEQLLLWCIDYAEAEAKADPNGVVPPAYYRHLAIVYRKDDRYDDEVDLLERYIAVADAIGHEPQKGVVDRLERARELAAEN